MKVKYQSFHLTSITSLLLKDPLLFMRSMSISHCSNHISLLKLSTSSPPHRTEYKAYRDVKPVKMIRAKSQYLPPDEKTSLETSYSATFRGQAPAQPASNKALERRRIRSLYSEPYIDPIKQVKTGPP